MINIIISPTLELQHVVMNEGYRVTLDVGRNQL
jgi:hypothetical protein